MTKLTNTMLEAAKKIAAAKIANDEKTVYCLTAHTMETEAGDLKKYEMYDAFFKLQALFVKEIEKQVKNLQCKSKKVQQEVYIPYGHLYSLGVQEKTLIRTVFDIVEGDGISTAVTYGKAKVNKQIIEVYHVSGIEWNIV